MIIRLPFFSSIAPDGHSDKTDTQAEEEGFRHEIKGDAQSQADEQTAYKVVEVSDRISINGTAIMLKRAGTAKGMNEVKGATTGLAIPRPIVPSRQPPDFLGRLFNTL